jgi:hypothetical protein
VHCRLGGAQGDAPISKKMFNSISSTGCRGDAPISIGVALRFRLPGARETLRFRLQSHSDFDYNVLRSRLESQSDFDWGARSDFGLNSKPGELGWLGGRAGLPPWSSLHPVDCRPSLVVGLGSAADGAHAQGPAPSIRLERDILIGGRKRRHRLHPPWSSSRDGFQIDPDSHPGAPGRSSLPPWSASPPERGAPLPSTGNAIGKEKGGRNELES